MFLPVELRERLARLAPTWRLVQQAGKRLTDKVIRYSIRFSPTEEHRTFLVTLLAGAASGLLAVAFHVAIRGAGASLIERAEAAPDYHWVYWTILCPTIGGLLVGLALHYWFPACRGSGIPQIKTAYAIQTDRVRLRDGVAKFCLTVLQLGSGASLGREGPTVQICAAATSALGRWFALSPRSVRRMLPVGAAAGVAAAFNAPIAAVTFTVEEIVGGLDQTVLSGVVVAAALAAVIEHTALGEHPVFTLNHEVGLRDVRSLVFYALLGIATGLISVLFTKGLLALRARFRGWNAVPSWVHPAVGGLATGSFAVAGLLVVQSSGVAGGGYAELSKALNGSLPILTLVVLGVLKVLATMFSYASGGAGGLFAPSLFIGAMFGGAMGWLDQAVWGEAVTGEFVIGEFALVGMGAAFAGIIRAPITSVLIIFEMTGGYGLVLPLMIANSTAYVVARRLDARNLYDALLEQDGVHLPQAPASAARLDALSVADAMTQQVHSLSATTTMADALQEVSRDGFGAYPVVDPDGKCLGVVTRARIQRINAEGGGALTVGERVRLKEYVLAQDPLLHAVLRMNSVGTRQLPVVSAEGHRLEGIVSMSDIVRAQAKAADERSALPMREPPSAEQTQH